MQTLHTVCGDIKRDLGTLNAEIGHLKSERQSLVDDIGDLKALKNKIVGGLVVIGIVLATIIGFVWYFVGPIWGTLTVMAKEYEVHKADRAAAVEDARGANAAVAVVNGN